jgi:hypothetical protein
MGKIIRSPHAGRINEDDVYDEDTAEWLKATDQLVYGDPPLDPDREKRFDVWLNRRHQETIEHARKVYGGTAAAAIRAALELLRERMGLDTIVPHIPEGNESN